MIPLLITVCYDNNGFSGVVTLKSPGGVFVLEVFPIRKQIIVLNYFPLYINLFGDLFMLPCIFHVN